MRTGFKPALIDKDRRSEGRRALHLATSATQSGRQVPVEILDLSAKGVMLSTKARLEAGELLAVMLTDGVRRGASVVWRSDKLFGCKFLEPLSKAELSASLLASDPMPHHGETGAPTLGQRIRSLRCASLHTMEELAQLAGVSKPTLWRWETDQSLPRPQTLDRLAEIFGVDARELRSGEVIPATPESGNDRPPVASSVASIVQCAREEIATVAGVEPRQVRIVIDFS